MFTEARGSACGRAGTAADSCHADVANMASAACFRAQGHSHTHSHHQERSQGSSNNSSRDSGPDTRLCRIATSWSMLLAWGLAAVLAHWMLPVAHAIPVRYCSSYGHSLEGPLCYQRCRLGYSPMACHCVSHNGTYFRGCGVKPSTCDARSFSQPQLPAVVDRGAFTLVLTADPQPYRIGEVNGRSPQTAIHNNAMMVKMVNRVTQLQAWPLMVGGGSIQAPRSVVVLGDLTEYFGIDEEDTFRHFYDPSYPRAAGQEYVQYPTWLMFGNHDYVINERKCEGVWGREACRRRAVEQMRAALSPHCSGSDVFSGLPKQNITALDIGSMSYCFDYHSYHFIVLQYNPR